MSDDSRVIVLDPSRFNVFETGARLLSILAFPAPHEVELYEAAADALCSDLLHSTAGDSSANADWWRHEYPEYFAIDGRERARRLRTTDRRFRDRMVASRMALGFFQEALSGQPAKLPTPMSRLSLNELAKLVQVQTRESDLENLEKRVWRPSLPVIHLAVAMQVTFRIRGPDGPKFGYRLDDKELQDFVVALSQVFENIVLSDPRFGRKRANIIRLRRSSVSEH